MGDARLRELVRLFRLAIVGEIPAQQEHVCLLCRLCKHSLQGLVRHFGVMEIPEGRPSFGCLSLDVVIVRLPLLRWRLSNGRSL